ncbi:WD repeat-containing protein 6 [Kalmusia sp. IMI 367209]|nr:WD repeat-containing protein 6 [Kalmusia sp. IMI 367209]
MSQIIPILFQSTSSLQALDQSSTLHIYYGNHQTGYLWLQAPLLISEAQNIRNQGLQRLLASCSDDRTIRIWDVSTIFANEEDTSHHEDLELQRTRHTGFCSASFDTDASSVDSVAIGWGHTSRVWRVDFLEDYASPNGIFLVSSGEDATSRTWQLLTKGHETPVKSDIPPWQLRLVDTAAYHSGKNIWSMSIPTALSNSQEVTLGGADSKITQFPLAPSTLSRQTNSANDQLQYTVEAIVASTLASGDAPSSERDAMHRSSKRTDIFRSYAFLDKSSFILTTDSGKIYLTNWSSKKDGSISDSKLVTQLDDLAGYSVCAGEESLHVAFIAGSKGSLYAYASNTLNLTKLHTVKGKIGDIFIIPLKSSIHSKQVILLITLVGQKAAQLLHIDLSATNGPALSWTIDVPISDQLTGLAITSVVYANTALCGQFVFLGFRRGSVAIYRISARGVNDTDGAPAELIRIIEAVHGKEAVTAMFWICDSPHSSSGHLASTGRDGCLAIHFINLATNSVYLVHNLTLPIGPNIEGLYLHQDQLHVYGFSSKKFVSYNTATEQEIMNVETGGAHRSWAFQPRSVFQGGGTLIWTRASSMHIRSQNGPNHQVIRSGGHGREIKAVTVSNTFESNKNNRQLIATGAEDTDIKIFEYEDNHLICRRTLRKHTTGIQHLQWSADGTYLFSSGGCEEFYIWRVRLLPAELGGIGVTCEAVCAPESEHSDLRIMAFDALNRDDGFIISLVFSNSHIKVHILHPSTHHLIGRPLKVKQVYNYDTAARKWHTLATGIYFTSCLTQCVFLSTHTILTAGTDGHAVLWPLSGLRCPEALARDPSSPSTQPTLTWHSPTRIHQSTSKTLTTYALANGSTLIISGGDDATLSFLLTSPPTQDNKTRYAHPPIIATRTHASAVTACAVLPHESRIFVLTSGNDQWVRLWEVILTEGTDGAGESGDALRIRRVGRVKTSVADVSSMALLDGVGHADEIASRVLICGVGMEVIRVEWVGT